MKMQDMFIQRVLDRIEQNRLIPLKSVGIIGFSGGRDSLALLYLLRDIQNSGAIDFKLSALIVDHQLRDESHSDALNAQKIGEKLGIRAKIVSAPSLKLESANIEERAREVRKELLLAEKARIGADWIALAHHQNDQAETVMMRLLRGAGPKGLSGMRIKNNCIIRPLLYESRESIDLYLEQKGIQAIEDPSNQDRRFWRNRIRKEILPRLKEENPLIIETLGRLADNCQEESDALREIADATCQNLMDASGKIDIDALTQLSTGLLHRVIFSALAHRGSVRGIERKHIRAIVGLFENVKGSSRIDLPGGCVERRYDTLFIYPDKGGKSNLFSDSRIEGEGVWKIGDDHYLKVSRREAKANDFFAIPEENLQFPLWVRSVAPGDKIEIRGGKKKVSDVLIDEKIALHQRNAIPLIFSDEKLVLIVGVKRAAGFYCKAGKAAFFFEKL